MSRVGEGGAIEGPQSIGFHSGPYSSACPEIPSIAHFAVLVWVLRYWVKKGQYILDEDTDKVDKDDEDDKDEDIDEGEEELSDSFVDNCELEAFVESKLTTKN